MLVGLLSRACRPPAHRLYSPFAPRVHAAQGASVSKLIHAVLGLLLSLHHEAERPGWEQMAEVSRRQFSLLRKALLRAMPSLASVCESPAS